MKWKQGLVYAGIMSIYLVFPSAAYSLNAFFPPANGTYQLAIGGAGIALPTDATSAIVNPAAVVRVKDNLMLSPVLMRQWPTMNSSKALLGNPNAGTQHPIAYKWIPANDSGASFHIRPNLAVAINLTGGGSVVKYAAPRFNPIFFTPPGSNYDHQASLAAMLVPISLSWQATPRSSYGASVIFANTTAKADIAIPPTFAETKGNLDLDYAQGVGAQIAGLWDLTDNISFALTARSKVYNQRLKKYKDLFFTSADFPPIISTGVTWHMSDRTNLSFGFKEILFKDVKLFRERPTKGGFGWRNQPVYMMGIQHKWNEKFTGGVGFNYGRSPIPNRHLFPNLLIPTIVEQHYTAGVVYQCNRAVKLGFATGYSPRHSQTATTANNPVSMGGAGAKMSTKQMLYVVSVEFSLEKADYSKQKRDQISTTFEPDLSVLNS